MAAAVEIRGRWLYNPTEGLLEEQEERTVRVTNNRIRTTRREVYTPDLKLSIQDQEKRYIEAENEEQRARESLLNWLMINKGMSRWRAPAIVNLCFENPAALSQELQDVYDEYTRLTQNTPYIPPHVRMAVNRIIQLNPAFMITVTLPIWADDEETVEYVNRLLKRTNKSIWGHKWWEYPDGGLCGLAVGEPHELSKDLRGTLHFHLLIRQNEKLGSAAVLRDFLHAQIPKVLHKGRPLFSATLIHVEAIDHIKGLAFYLTKSFRFRDFKDGDFQLPLTSRGIEGLMPRSRKAVRNF